ncbi:MAG: HAD hydrolase-like protein [Bdellovibrionales bacterium]|nr:HAD hydrolase-like protein [Bdellovibrionales bacterium]
MPVSAILFDLEGVLLRAKTHEPLPGSRGLFCFLQQHEIPFGIITNNTVETPEAILEILSERELPIQSSQLLTPLLFLSNELSRIRSAIVLGSSTLETFVREHGVEIRQTPDVDAVICGGGYTITNQLLHAAHTAIAERHSAFLCLHRNRVFNDASGLVRPDVGAIVVGLEYSTGHPAKTLGKPSADYFSKATEQWRIPAEEILLISDDPISDLGGGHAMGYRTGFVSTGKYSRELLSKLEIAPNYVWKDLCEATAELATVLPRSE